MLSNEHQEILTAFETALRAYRPEATVELRTYYSRRLMLWAQEDERSVLHLDHGDLLTWMTKGVGPSASTKKIVRSTLSVFYQWAIDVNRIEINPAEKLPAMRSPKGVPNPCPNAALKKAFSRCTRPVDVLMLLLGQYEAMRAGEIARLHTADVQDTELRVTGKGNKTRLVPLHPLVGEFMREFSTGYFFPSDKTPSGHMLPASIGKRVRFLLGYVPQHNAHSLRHKFGVDALELNYDLMALRDVMGHASVATTEIYTRASSKRLTAMVTDLPERADARTAIRLAKAQC